MTHSNGKEDFQGRTYMDLCLSRMFLLAWIGCFPEVAIGQNRLLSRGWYNIESAFVRRVCILGNTNQFLWATYIYWEVRIRFLNSVFFSSVCYRYESAFWKLYISWEFATDPNRILESVYFSGICYRSGSAFKSHVYLLVYPNRLWKATYLLWFINWFLKVVLNTVCW